MLLLVKSSWVLPCWRGTVPQKTEEDMGRAHATHEFVCSSRERWAQSVGMGEQKYKTVKHYHEPGDLHELTFFSLPLIRELNHAFDALLTVLDLCSPAAVNGSRFAQSRVVDSPVIDAHSRDARLPAKLAWPAEFSRAEEFAGPEKFSWVAKLSRAAKSSWAAERSGAKVGGMGSTHVSWQFSCDGVWQLEVELKPF
jgi:hypothetical protein